LLSNFKEKENKKMLNHPSVAKYDTFGVGTKKAKTPRNGGMA